MCPSQIVLFGEEIGSSWGTGSAEACDPDIVADAWVLALVMVSLDDLSSDRFEASSDGLEVFIELTNSVIEGLDVS